MVRQAALQRLDRGGFHALGAAGHLEFDTPLFLERLLAVALYLREMGKDILAAVIRRDESETLRLVEPLYDACCHTMLHKI